MTVTNTEGTGDTTSNGADAKRSNEPTAYVVLLGTGFDLDGDATTDPDEMTYRVHSTQTAMGQENAKKQACRRDAALLARTAPESTDPPVLACIPARSWAPRPARQKQRDPVLEV